MQPGEDVLKANAFITVDPVELASTNAQLKLEIAAQRRAYDLLEAETRGLSTLLTISTDCLWEQDAQYRFTSVVSEQGLIKAQTNNTLGNCRWDLDGVVPLSMSWESHGAILDARQPFRDFEYARTMADNSFRYVSISGMPVYDNQQQFVGYRGTSRDITARKQAETALSASESLFRTVIAALADAVIVRDAEGRITDCNTSAERLFGRTLDQIKGSTSVGSEWHIVRADGSPMPHDERPSVVARRTGLPQSGVVARYRRNDGFEVWVLINVRILVDAVTKESAGFVSTITDISKVKLGELEITKLNVELENRVLRRTAQLKAANNELEAFSYAVAHDLRSPLSTIDGFCALLKNEVSAEVGSRSHHYMTRIQTNVQNMGRLADGLLSLAHLTRAPLSCMTVDMSAEAVAILREYAEKDTGREVKITVEQGLLVQADSALLRQVLVNLLANAWKFTSKKTSAAISVGKKTDATAQTVYFVKDSGAGFDMAYVDKLFGTFQRLHSTEDFAGSGIGLATVKRIITRHNGNIWAESVVGEGSTFYFTLDCSGSARKTEAYSASSEVFLRHLDKASDSVTANVATNQDGSVFSLSEQQFAMTFDHSAVGMTLIGIDSRRFKVNSALCKMLGYSEAEMLALSFQDITHPDDIEEDLMQIKRALAGEIEAFQRVKRCIHKSGHIIWVSLTCSLIRNADRKPLHFISQIIDVAGRQTTAPR